MSRYRNSRNQILEGLYSINEDSQLYKGIFWITDLEDIDSNELYFQIPSDINGNVIGNMSLNAKSGTTFNHEKTWKSLNKRLTGGKEYNYFPRGRVEISRGRATIYANPNICTDEVKDWIIDKFNLNSHNGINKIVIIPDGSEHYKCYLDK